jgi:hypothetical protein
MRYAASMALTPIHLPAGREALRDYALEQLRSALRKTEHPEYLAPELLEVCEKLELPLSAAVVWLRTGAYAGDASARMFLQHAQGLKRLG